MIRSSKDKLFEHFWELHDYIDTGKPTRVIRMNFSMEEAKQLNFEKDKMKVKIQRRYGFPHTQNAYNLVLMEVPSIIYMMSYLNSLVNLR